MSRGVFLLRLLLPLWPAAAKHAAWIETLRHLRKGFGSSESIGSWQPGACISNNSSPTLWFLGNSVSRIHLFAALALLSKQQASTVSVDDQITQCGRGGEWKGRRPGQGLSCLGPCSCSDVAPGSNVKVVFVWQQRAWDETLDSALSGGRFSPKTAPIAQGDIVLMSSGLDSVYSVFKKTLTAKKAFGLDGRAIRGNYSFFAEQWRTALAKDAERLAASVATAWRGGRRVFWRSNTLDCYPTNRTRPEFAAGLRPGTPGRSMMDSLGFASLSSWMNSLLAEHDNTVRVALERQGLPVLDMREIELEVNGCTAHGDDASVSACRCEGYLDKSKLHPDPLRASRQVAKLLARMDEYCHLRI